MQIEAPPRSTGKPPEAVPRQPHDASGRIAQLQQSIGNQGVQRMLQRKAGPAGEPIAVSGGPQQPQHTGASSTQTQPMQTPGQTTGPTRPQPFTAVFSIAMHGSRAHSVCNIPETPGCVVKWAKWRLVDATGAPVMGKVTVSERFTKVSGPDSVFNKLIPQSNTTDKGFFDDCYGLCVPDDVPAFTLEVEQNHLVDGQVVSKNLITYSKGSISLRVCQRGQKGFGPPCRRF